MTGSLGSSFSLSIASLREAYLSASAAPVDVVREVYSRIEHDRRDDVWISVRSFDEALNIARKLESFSCSKLPLYGVPFSVKDNIDVCGLQTTAACPAYSYMPAQSASVVRYLENSGAICIGKTNLDQFATGLNGTRSPYGECRSAFNKNYASGGSSSGSAVSVALQQVSFSLGTDTGGSGRIPAGLNHIFGLKPTVGSLSSHGLVPCCPSLDCPSVFSLAVEDAVLVADVMHSYDSLDSTLRVRRPGFEFGLSELPTDISILVPELSQLEFFGNQAGHDLYLQALDYISELGFRLQHFDYSPFIEAGRLLFNGPWLADRFASIGEFLIANPSDVLDTTYAIVEGGSSITGEEVFKAQQRVAHLKSIVHSLLQSNNLLLLPTVAPLYTVEQLKKDPIALNNHFGYYSYFANILDLCAVSFPHGFYSNGMPFGLTAMGPAFSDAVVARFAKVLTDPLGHVFGKSRL
ncbi:MAG: amidase [Cyanobium sp. NAT70]|nr:amidase [Cyanobium sp. NAT70]|tara:strand:- start:1073 stop:2467 length:1395 start_codon:yes stop_codon:yes gene_type:complete